MHRSGISPNEHGSLEHNLLSAPRSRSGLWVVDLIAGTTTKGGPKIRAQLDQDHYLTGINTSDKHLPGIPITKHNFNGEWITHHLAATPPQ